MEGPCLYPTEVGRCAGDPPGVLAWRRPVAYGGRGNVRSPRSQDKVRRDLDHLLRQGPKRLDTVLAPHSTDDLEALPQTSLDDGEPPISLGRFHSTVIFRHMVEEGVPLAGCAWPIPSLLQR